MDLKIEIMKKQLLLIISFVLINQTTYGQQVTIGTQMWQTTNLDVTSYRDGTPIPQVTDPTAWAGLITGAWCKTPPVTVAPFAVAVVKAPTLFAPPLIRRSHWVPV